jgi:nitroreductase
MDALDAIRSRRCIRVYEERATPKEVLQEIIDCARLAPSARNIQPWEFVVVTKREMLKKIADLTDHGKHISKAAACVVVCCRNTKYFLEDGSAATQNILLAAHASGLASCWVAGHKKPYCEAVKGILEIPEEYIIISLVPIGYTASKVEPHGKRALDEVLHWEKF